MMSKPTMHAVSVPPPIMIEPPSAAGVSCFPYLIALQPEYPLDDKEGEENKFKSLYENDEFMVYEFKVRRCPRGRSHDWTQCPYVHPGEKARRRDPRLWHYSGSPCPDYRKGSCRRGDACELAHGVFETWLHPSRYRTELCNDGVICQRRVCFFAHSPEQLRVLTLVASHESPKRKQMSELLLSLSPRSTLKPPLTSPQSDCSSPGSPVGLAEVLALMGRLGLCAGRVGPELPLGSPEVQRDGNSGLSTAPASSWKRPAVEEVEDESASLPDVGWILELVD